MRRFPCTDKVATKTVTGADGRAYKVDTYVTWRQITNSGSTTGRLVKLVSIVVRGSSSPYPIYAKVSSAFDESTGQYGRPGLPGSRRCRAASSSSPRRA